MFDNTYYLQNDNELENETLEEERMKCLKVSGGIQRELCLKMYENQDEIINMINESVYKRKTISIKLDLNNLRLALKTITFNYSYKIIGLEIQNNIIDELNDLNDYSLYFINTHYDYISLPFNIIKKYSTVQKKENSVKYIFNEEIAKTNYSIFHKMTNLSIGFFKSFDIINNINDPNIFRDYDYNYSNSCISVNLQIDKYEDNIEKYYSISENNNWSLLFPRRDYLRCKNINTLNNVIDTFYKGKQSHYSYNIMHYTNEENNFSNYLYLYYKKTDNVKNNDSINKSTPSINFIFKEREKINKNKSLKTNETKNTVEPDNTDNADNADNTDKEYDFVEDIEDINNNTNDTNNTCTAYEHNQYIKLIEITENEEYIIYKYELPVNYSHDNQHGDNVLNDKTDTTTYGMCKYYEHVYHLEQRGGYKKKDYSYFDKKNINFNINPVPDDIVLSYTNYISYHYGYDYILYEPVKIKYL